MTAIPFWKTELRTGLQPVDLTHHIGGIADLIELCFAADMDAGGRSVIREMRFVSRFGWALPVLNGLGLAQYPWLQGFVWVEEGKVVGCVNTQSATDHAAAWLIANVAVHPRFRRQGIALAMMQATLDLIRSQSGATALLQVDDDNQGAIELYRQMGFRRIATRTAWARPALTPAPELPPTDLEIRSRRSDEWADEMALAQRVRPEGFLWNQPLRASDFNPSPVRSLEHWLAAQTQEHWVAVDSHTHQMAGSLTVRINYPDGDRLILCAHPDYQGRVEKPLLAQGLHRVAQRPWVTRIEHPADDAAAETALREYKFEPGRILRWMKLSLR
jgi:ribosomal protein S18 acetylase RimI-like enzyme